MIQIQDLLGRLTKVKRVGEGEWIASSPTRRDSNPSLAIKLTHDQKILLKDFGGSSVEQICDAIGIGIHDLFPDNLSKDYDKRIIYPFSSNILKALRFELGIALVSGIHMVKDKKLTEDDMDRLALAIERIKEAYELCLK